MAFTGNYICTSYKKELLSGKHSHDVSGGHTFKVALYDSTATLTADTTDYTTTGEIAATGGYSTGGMTLTNVNPASGSGRAWTDFADLTISNATITARGALVYNTTYGGGAGTTNAVMVLDFGRDIVKSNQDFVITFPTADAWNAILLIK